VRVSRRQEFFDDASEAYASLSQRSRKAAERLLDELERLVDQLCRFPKIGRRRPQLGAGVRSFPLRRFRYVVFYRIQQDDVMLLRLLHGARRVRRKMLGD
jgi:toxin ParE1/3/4